MDPVTLLAGVGTAAGGLGSLASALGLGGGGSSGPSAWEKRIQEEQYNLLKDILGPSIAQLTPAQTQADLYQLALMTGQGLVPGMGTNVPPAGTATAAAPANVSGGPYPYITSPTDSSQALSATLPALYAQAPQNLNTLEAQQWMQQYGITAPRGAGMATPTDWIQQGSTRYAPYTPPPGGLTPTADLAGLFYQGQGGAMTPFQMAQQAAQKPVAQGYAPTAGQIEQKPSMTATQPAGTLNMGGTPDWMSMLSGQGGLMGLEAQNQMQQYLASIGLTPLQAQLQANQIGAQQQILPETTGLTLEQIAAMRELLPFQTGLARTQYETETGLVPQRGQTESEQLAMKRNLLGGGGYGGLGTQYGFSGELDTALGQTGQYLQNLGLLRSGVMPELSTKRAADIAERTEGQRRAEQFGLLQLGMMG